MKFILKMLLFIANFYVIDSYKIHGILPNKIPIDFAKEKEIHETILTIQLSESELNFQFMLHISDYDLRYDRELLEDAWVYCEPNKIARDWRVVEEYFYSCCKQIENKGFEYNYSCPVPPFPNRDILIDLFLDDTFPIYIKQFSNISLSKWEYSKYNMEYTQTEEIYKIIHDSIIWMIFLWTISCITYTFMIYINKWSNKYEIIFTVIHIFITGIIIYFETNTYINTSNESFQKDIFLFSLVNTFYSLFLIYIPHHGDPSDPHSIEQRVPVEDIVFKFSLKIFKHPITKQISSLFYIVSFIFEIISIYFICDFLRQKYDLSFEILVLISTFKFIFKLIFLVSFLTAIYEVHIPVQINNDTGQLLQILPESHYDRVLSSFITNKKVKPKNNEDLQNKMVGIYDRKIKQIIPFQNIFKNGEIIGFQNVNTEYSGILWQIGRIKKNKINIYDSTKNKRIYFLNIGYGQVFLPDIIDSKKKYYCI